VTPQLVGDRVGDISSGAVLAGKRDEDARWMVAGRHAASVAPEFDLGIR
jgi:hypothetical protein